MLQLALPLWLLGEAGRAQELAARGLAVAARSDHVPVVTYGYTWKCTLDAIRGDAAQALACAEAISGLAREHDLPFWLAIGTFFGDWARWQSGDRTVSLSNMRQSVQYFVDEGLTWYSLLARMLFAVPQAEAGDVEAGLATLDDCLAEMSTTGLRWLEAETNRQRAELLANYCPADLAGAEQYYETAITIAGRQEARSFELRAAIGLARVYCATGRERAAQNLLTPILAAFGNESGLAEIAQARRLLVSVADTLHSQ
jgi:predicted ATPase